MRSELEDLIEHLERYRAITLQVFDLIDEDDLGWRPSPEQYSLGQQLLHIHIAQAEDRFAHGLLEDDWSMDRVRFSAELPTADDRCRGHGGRGSGAEGDQDRSDQGATGRMRRLDIRRSEARSRSPK